MSFGILKMFRTSSRSFIEALGSNCNGLFKRPFSKRDSIRAYPMNDFAFKEVFGNNEPILKEFLNDTLPIGKIKELTVTKNTFTPTGSEAKNRSVDVICKLDSGTIVIVEVQVLREHDFCNRIVNYACRAYASQVKKAKKYDTAFPVILLSVCNFNIFPKDIVPRYLSDHRLVHTDSQKVFLDQLRFVFMELPKFGSNKYRSKLKEVILPADLQAADYWPFFFKYAHLLDGTTIASIKDKKPTVASAIDALDFYCWSEDKQLAYDMAEHKRAAVNNAYEDGVKHTLSMSVEEFIELKKKYEENE